MIALCIIFVKSDAYSILFGTDWRLVFFFSDAYSMCASAAHS